LSCVEALLAGNFSLRHYPLCKSLLFALAIIPLALEFASEMIWLECICYRFHGTAVARLRSARCKDNALNGKKLKYEIRQRSTHLRMGQISIVVFRLDGRCVGDADSELYHNGERGPFLLLSHFSHFRSDWFGSSIRCGATMTQTSEAAWFGLYGPFISA